MRRAACAVPSLLTAVVLAGCAGVTSQPRMVEGECADMHGAEVCTWAFVDGSGRVVEYGATIPLALVDNAPHDMQMAWPPVPGVIARMPPEVISSTGIDHLTVYWVPHGHPPGVYLTPHFDFHFNVVTSAERETIDCSDATKPAALPTGYAFVDLRAPGLGMLVGLCVPNMGMHALPAVDLQDGARFGSSVVMGYYGGQPIFVEPMVAGDMLTRRESFEAPIPAVAEQPNGVRLPRHFRAEYDAAGDAYRLILSGY